ncbi:ECF transporter S component [Natribacillus halophilus]|uniref:Energy-coupling factor transport system substrate-specific component n=1 Tax=Natribacillus halophilus TaxID=549003 RepID=A0A1G8MYH1_9BACI|nr:ECF transporter S component [Natribacillus halophilus]SDI72954.1 energy-coupling factor transport system substrate-specific component [Natribacillus halophilus]
MTTKKITLLAVLIALCVVGRIVFVYIPNVQPVSAIIIICSFFMGPVFGLILAVGSAILTNLFLGSGIWTIFQILAWGTIGLFSGWLGVIFPNMKIKSLAFIGALLGYLYGFIVSLNMLVIANHFLAYYLAGLPFDTYHAMGNLIFIVLLSPFLRKLLWDYREENYGYKGKRLS